MKKVLLIAIAVLTFGTANAQHSKQMNIAKKHQVEQKPTFKKDIKLVGEKIGVKPVLDKATKMFQATTKKQTIKPVKMFNAARAGEVQQTYNAFGTVRSTGEQTNWEMTSGTTTIDGQEVNYLVNVIPDLVFEEPEDIPVEYTIQDNKIVIEPTLIASFPDEEAPTGTYYIFLEDANSNDGFIRLALDNNGGITGSYTIIYSIYPAATYNFDDWVATFDGVGSVQYILPGQIKAPEVSFEQGNLILFAGPGLNGYSYLANYGMTGAYATTKFVNRTTDVATAWEWKAYDSNLEGVVEEPYMTGSNKDFSLYMQDGYTKNVQLIGTNQTASSEPFIYGAGKSSISDCYIFAGGMESEWMVNDETPAIQTRQDPDGDLMFYTNWGTPDIASNSMSKIYLYHEKPAAPLYIEGITLPILGFTANEDFNLHIKIQKCTYPAGATSPTLGEVIAEGDATLDNVNSDFDVLSGIEIPLYAEDEDGMSTDLDYLFLEDEFVIVIEGWDNGTFSGRLGSQDVPLDNARASTWFEKSGQEGSMYSYTTWKTALLVGFLGATYGYLKTDDSTELTFPEEGGSQTIHIKPMLSTADGETMLFVDQNSEVPEWISLDIENESYTQDDWSFDLAVTAEPLSSASGAPRKEEAAGRTASFTLVQPGAKLDFTVTQGAVTGITDVKVTKTATDGKVYNVAGQRLNSNAKGLIVKDGKKYIVK